MAEQDPAMMAVDSSGVVYQVESWPVEVGGGGGGGEAPASGGGGDSGAPAGNEFIAVCGSPTHGGWAGAIFDNWSAANEQVLSHNEQNMDVPRHEDAYVALRWGSNWRGPVDANGSL